MPCFSNPDEKEPTDDACGCCFGPCFPNGTFAVLFAQAFLTFGCFMACASMMDCRFVKVQGNDVDDILAPIYPFYFLSYDPANSTTRGLGMFFFQDADGDCAYDIFNYNNESDSYTHAAGLYKDFLGPDWTTARSTGSSATILALVLWLWVLTLSCSAQTSAVRKVLAFLLAIVVVPLFSICFVALNSDLCTQELEDGCDFGQSAGFAVAAVVLFFFSGFFLLLTKNYEIEQQGGNTNRQTSRQNHRRREHPINDDESTDSAVVGGSGNEQEIEVLDGIGDAQEIPANQIPADMASWVNPTVVSCST